MSPAVDYTSCGPCWSGAFAKSKHRRRTRDRCRPQLTVRKRLVVARLRNVNKNFPREEGDLTEWTRTDRSFGFHCWRASEMLLLVRVTGLLMFDSEHFLARPLERINDWEIHPVLTLEFCETGNDLRGQQRIGCFSFTAATRVRLPHGTPVTAQVPALKR